MALIYTTVHLNVHLSVQNTNQMTNHSNMNDEELQAMQQAMLDMQDEF